MVTSGPNQYSPVWNSFNNPRQTPPCPGQASRLLVPSKVKAQAGAVVPGALAHLQIGRAYAIQGETAKASAAYQDFLMLWKDADRDIPVLIAANAEYTKLHQLLGSLAEQVRLGPRVLSGRLVALPVK
jgi:hypothetical protein